MVYSDAVVPTERSGAMRSITRRTPRDSKRAASNIVIAWRTSPKVTGVSPTLKSLASDASATLSHIEVSVRFVVANHERRAPDFVAIALSTTADNRSRSSSAASSLPIVTSVSWVTPRL